jgi:hypothetical protein
MDQGAVTRSITNSLVEVDTLLDRLQLSPVDAGHPNINSTTSEFRKCATEKHDAFETGTAINWESLIYMLKLDADVGIKGTGPSWGCRKRIRYSAIMLWVNNTSERNRLRPTCR